MICLVGCSFFVKKYNESKIIFMKKEIKKVKRNIDYANKL